MAVEQNQNLPESVQTQSLWKKIINKTKELFSGRKSNNLASSETLYSGPKFSRRLLLKLTAAQTIAGGLSALDVKFAKGNRETPQHAEAVDNTFEMPLEQRFPFELPAGTESTQSLDNLTLFLNKDKIPVGYVFYNLDNSKEYTVTELTPEQQAEFIFAKYVAQQPQESGVSNPQVSNLVLKDPYFKENLYDKIDLFSPTEQQPWFLEPPEDLVSTEKLQELGIFIHQHTSPECSKLFLREHIYQPGGILEGLSLLNKQIRSEGLKVVQKNELHVLLLNSPYVCKEGCTDVQKYVLGEKGVDVLATAYSVIAEQRQNKYQRIQNYIRLAEEQYLASTTEEEKEATESLILMEKMRLQHLVGLQDFEFFHSGTSGFTAGMYMKLEDNKDVILMPVGLGDTHNTRNNYIGFLPSGDIVMSSRDTIQIYENFSQPTMLMPRIDQSYPTANYAELPVDENGNENKYLYGAQTDIGNNFRHELIHLVSDSIIPKLQERDLLSKFTWYKNLKEFVGDENFSITAPDASDREVDAVAVLTIKQANAFLRSNKDDSKYDVVFTTIPNEDNPSGGYLITEKQPATPDVNI